VLKAYLHSLFSLFSARFRPIFSAGFQNEAKQKSLKSTIYIPRIAFFNCLAMLLIQQCIPCKALEINILDCPYAHGTVIDHLVDAPALSANNASQTALHI